MPVSYLREGRVQQGQLTLGRALGKGSLVPRIFDRGADYYVFGGLAFVSLTRNLLDSGKEWLPAPIAALAKQEPDAERDEVVLLVDVLSSEVNAGYSDERWEVVRGVDGRRTRNLRALVQAVEAPSSERLVSFDLSNGYKVTVDGKEALASASEVLGRYGIASDRSARLGLSSEAPAIARVPVALADGAPAGGR